MVGTVLSQKPGRLQRFRNESSFARPDAEQRPDETSQRSLWLVGVPYLAFSFGARNDEFLNLRH